MNDNLYIEKNLEVDSKKLNRMKVRILDLERKNILTNSKTDSEMIEKIQKIIKEEAKKCY